MRRGAARAALGACAGLLTRAACAAVLTLAACAAPEPQLARAYDLVVWRDGATRDARADAIGACELAATGAALGMSQDRIEAAARATDPGTHSEVLVSCLRGRGYVIAELPVCDAAGRASGAARPILSLERLPPLASVRCYVPSSDAVVF